MSTSFKSLVTDIEYLSKTRQVYQNELSFAGKGLKLNKKEDGKWALLNSYLLFLFSLNTCEYFLTFIQF